MALKDWEKRKSNVPDREYEFFNKKEHGMLWIQNIRGIAYYVNVSYFDSNSLGKNFINRRFSTETQALAYAKSYMRSH